MAQPPSTPHPHQRLSVVGRILASLRNNFFTGVVVIAPIGLTVWLIWTVVGWVDDVVMPFVPRYYHPENMLNRWLDNAPDSAEWVDVNIRGVGVVVFLIFTVLVGWIAKGIVGRSAIRMGEDIVGRVPVIRPIYNGLKQIAQTVFAPSEAKFDRICLVEFPRRGMWSVAFIASAARGEIRHRLGEQSGGEEILTLFKPMTPNPTTGFLIFVRRSDVIELDMSLEEAAKLVISGGLVYPEEATGAPAPASAAGWSAAAGR